MNYSDRSQKMLGSEGYYFDDLRRIRAGKNTRTVDFGKLWDVLRSNDASLLEDSKWMFDLKDNKYLDMNADRTVESMNQKVSYSTYPRVGNSFLRKYLQMITGIATGSDMTIEFNQDMQLNMNKAEEITDSSVWIYKSHDPYFVPFHQKAKANKLICCSRNPYDTIAS